MARPNFNPAVSFHRRALERPDALALSVSGKDFTYARLAASACRVGRWIEKGGPAVRVGVLASRSFEAYAGVLGCCWAGAAYIPLSPRAPAQALLEQMRRAGLDALLADAAGAEALARLPAKALPRRVLTRWPLPGRGRWTPPAPMASGSLVYVTFTSGTTGEPKGVPATAGNLRHFLRALRTLYPLRSSDRWSQFYELNYDAAAMEMWSAWDTGASLHVVPQAQRLCPTRMIQKERLTVWTSTPSVAEMMLRLSMLKPGSLSSLRLAFFMGEPLSVSLARAWKRAAPSGELVNLYGPTEATVVCLAQDFSGREDATPGKNFVSIGRPFPGMAAGVVDSLGSFLPSGRKGELALHGPQLAGGYWGAPPAADGPFRRLRHPRLGTGLWYLTRDLGFEDRRGRFHYLGRMDRQVKILGQRVQLEGVEHRLRALSGRESVAAVGWPVAKGMIQGMVAFIAGGRSGPADLQEKLRRRLPAPMVPDRLVFLKKLPLTPSGKIDRRALVRRLNRKAR